MKKFNLILFVSLLVTCKENLPKLDPRITEFYSPKQGVLPYFKGEILDPYWSDSEKPADLRKLRALEMESHLKTKVNLSEFKDKYKILVFFYAKCSGICPMITRNLMQFLPKLENQNDLIILSITINPDIDSPDILNDYRNRYGISQDNWLFLTGKKEDIYEMARKEFGADVKLIKGKYDLNDFVHTENVFLIDKENYLRGIYRAKGTGDLERLKTEFEILDKRK